jgi:hypothetical protein
MEVLSAKHFDAQEKLLQEARVLESARTYR